MERDFETGANASEPLELEKPFSWFKFVKIFFKVIYVILKTAWLTVWTLYQIALGAVLVLLVWGALKVADYFSLREINALRHHPPPTTAFMEIEKARVRDSCYAARKPLPDTLVQYAWIPLDSIPKVIQEVALVAEDSKFFDHQGFDLEQIEYALVSNHQAGRPARGASTITQQLAKNLYLSQDKEMSRKFHEAAITLLLEHYLTKPRILEIYLNVAQLDNRVFGIRAAARHYFGKEPYQLTQEEAVNLVCLLPSPSKWNFRKPNNAFLQHKRLVMRNYALYKGIKNTVDTTLTDSTGGWQNKVLSDLSEKLSEDEWKTLRSRPAAEAPEDSSDQGGDSTQGKSEGAKRAPIDIDSL